MNKYEELLDYICVKLGWCGSIIDGEFKHVDQYIPESGFVTASEFAEWVILADGEDPFGELSKKRGRMAKLEAAFIKYMGGDKIPVEEFAL